MRNHDRRGINWLLLISLTACLAVSILSIRSLLSTATLYTRHAEAVAQASELLELTGRRLGHSTLAADLRVSEEMMARAEDLSYAYRLCVGNSVFREEVAREAVYPLLSGFADALSQVVASPDRQPDIDTTDAIARAALTLSEEMDRLANDLRELNNKYCDGRIARILHVIPSILGHCEREVRARYATFVSDAIARLQAEGLWDVLLASMRDHYEI